MYAPYFALFRIRFTHSLQYRAAALAGLFTQFAWGFMYILAFAAFYRESPDAFPMSFEQTVAYIWMQQAFLTLFALWFWDKSISGVIESGDIAYELVRPMDLYGRWATTIASSRIARCVMRAAPIFAVAFFLPAPFRLTISMNLQTAAIFALSVALSLGVAVAFSMLVYITVIHTLNGAGVRLIAAVASDFLTGGIIPIPFFPAALRTVVEFSPFAAMQNTPLLIFNGYLTDAALARAVGLQVFWLAALVVIGRVLMARSLQRIVVQGG
ncbi:MAG: ABC-2 family transporter protein [Defluviitaleaceae bacterium]|nr:ABC-2 family transporter protein [Defluviitaleaceae bacterium]